MKDPILSSYTPEELMYEFLDRKARTEYIEVAAKEEEEKKEDDKLDEAMRWAEEEEAKDKAEEAARLATANMSPSDGIDIPITNPSKGLTSEDLKWMEEQLAKEKAERGYDFGDDIHGEF